MIDRLKFISRFTVCIIIALFFLADLGLAKEYYVSPTGDDSHSGTFEEPFATLRQARDAVREDISNGLEENITVYLRGGIYPIRETLVFGLEDSPMSGYTVTYQAYRTESPTLSSGVPITGWKPFEGELEGLPNEAKGNVWVADMPEGLDRFYSLYNERGLIDRARVSFVSKARLPRSQDGVRTRWQNKDVLYYESGPFRNWSNISDIEIYKKPTRNWVANYLQLERVDLEDKAAYTTVQGTYRLSTLDGWLCNIPEGLNEPGRWIVNTEERKVYLWPENGRPSDHIVAPSLTEYIRVEGKNDIEGDDDVPVRGLTFSGLTFMHGKRMVLRNDSRGIQHDWEMFDEPNALIRFRGVEQSVIQNNTFKHSSSTAIRLDLYSRDNEIRNNRIDGMGLTGILLSGYGPGTKDVNQGNRVVNNEISRVGQLWFHGMAIFVFQSGNNYIAHNYIHDIPYDAIVVSGVRPRFYGYPFNNFPNFPKAYPNLREIMSIMRWDEIGDQPETEKATLEFAHSRNNVVEFNEVENAMMEGGDGNALYLSATLGNIYRYNFIHSTSTGPGLLRTDDDQYDSHVYGNILIGNKGSKMNVMLKHENLFENNICINWLEVAIGKGKSTVNRNIFYHPGSNTEIFGQGDDFAGQNNLYFTDDNVEGMENWLEERRQLADSEGKEFGQGSLVAEPNFVDMEHFDFHLKPDSPAKELGFEPIPFEKMGLQHEPSFERLRDGGFTLQSLMQTGKPFVHDRFSK